MAGIRAANTKPEIVLRRLIHRNGYRYRLHRKDLPGRPDIVLVSRRTAVFVNGCYWHGHRNCHLFRLPKSRTEFWSGKINANRLRDQRNHDDLEKLGWKVIVIWECAITKKQQLPACDLLEAFESAMCADFQLAEIRGR